jgi:DNA topoisomerase IB
MPRLRRSDPNDPGIERIRRGKGFSYHNGRGTIRNEPELERIRALAIPPAWTDVWISPDELGHIQAVGTDAAGRRQYLYHEQWRRNRDREKFKRLVRFAESLPAARDALFADLKLRGLVRERVMACAVRLLDIGTFRVGGEVYEEENETFGLATLRKRHVRIRGEGIVFEYVAKGGAEHSQVIQDAAVVATVRALKRRRGPADDPLLAYRTGRSDWHDVTSAQVNDWLKGLLGDDYSAKDFRTWNATVLAAVRLAGRAEEGDRKAAVTTTIEEVADMLGNTPAVCRESYIDPRVIKRYERGETIAPDLKRIARRRTPDRFAERSEIEASVVRLIS